MKIDWDRLLIELQRQQGTVDLGLLMLLIVEELTKPETPQDATRIAERASRPTN